MAGRVTGYLDHPGPIAFAHRGGAAGHFPENSWRAFEYAVGLGYAYLETDVHATADEVLVAFHDKTLDRVTDAAGRIARLPHREVAAARIGGTDPVPLLEDLLGAWPGVRFNVDVKDAPAIAPLVAVLRRTGAWDRVCITSFSARRLAATRRLLPRPVCMATSPIGVAALRGGLPAGAIASKFAALSVRCAQIPVSLATGRFVARAHTAGLQVHVWTVNDAATMNGLLDLGVDGIMTDQAGKLREVLAGRGGWHPRAAG
jgi:glycerophosphoryl diester phosphodiesterase